LLWSGPLVEKVHARTTSASIARQAGRQEGKSNQRPYVAH
jgi:hypothetical protein